MFFRLRSPTSSVVRQCRWYSQQLKPYYVTTPIFYPNAVPHIGHLFSLVIADTYARFSRIKDPNRPVIFLTGTDEHGLKIQKAAQDRSLSPSELCDGLSQNFRDLCTLADISQTRFIRTSERDHYKTVEWVWNALQEKDLIYKGTYEGWYSITDESFYPESQTKKIPATDTTPEMVVSIETGSLVEYSSETNYMFRLSAFRDALLKHYSSFHSIYPDQHLTQTIKSLQGELEDISISRPRSRLQWGIPVPGDDGHTIYVWMDALINYLTGIGYPECSTGWPVDLQVIGKDIVKFHAIYFPAILLALNLPLQTQLLSHSHWTSAQRKMSKSIGNVTDPVQAIEEFGVDAIRYYLLKVGGKFKDDVDWSYAQLTIHDNELQSLIGNLFMRITSKKIITKIVDVIPAQDPIFNPLLELQRNLPVAVATSMEAMDVTQAIESIIEMLHLANKVMTDVAPWKTSPDLAAQAHSVLLDVLRTAGIVLQPFVPGVSGRLLDALGVPSKERIWDLASTGTVGEVENGKRLFKLRE